MQEQYRGESVATALKIFMALLEQGELGHQDESELLQSYKNNPEVQDLFSDLIEPLADIKVLESIDHLYLCPNPGNRVLGYTNEELRQEMGLVNQKELHLAYFIIICLLALFYGSDTLEDISRYYVTVSELERFVTEKTSTLARQEDLPGLEQQVEFNLQSVVQLWQEMPEYNEKLVRLRSTTKNRISFLLKVCSFLEAQGLIALQGDREIYLMEKAKQVVYRYYSATGRKERLLTLILGEGND